MPQNIHYWHWDSHPFDGEIMLSAPSVVKVASLLSICATVMSCTIPGIRPEGRTATVSAHAPASSADVLARANQWFARNGFTVERGAVDSELRCYSTIGADGHVETRAVVEFLITSSTAEATSYRVTGYTVRGRPPAFARVAENAPEAGAAVSSLVAYLSCPSAAWPRCP
jgi:hypothetical protein